VSRTSTASSSRRSAAARPTDGVPQRPTEIRAALHALGVRPTRRLGQSFLADPFVADAEAALAATGSPESTVEIGGGLGVLTAALLRRGLTPLTVVERDPRLAAHLRATFGERVAVEDTDALARTYRPVDNVVGNFPYAIATPLLVHLFTARVPRITFLIQREVAQRLAAGPGSREYGRLSILARLYGEVELYRTVPAASFEPMPEVESRLVVHIARPGPLPVPSVPEFERTVWQLFRSRRKQLGNLLPRVAGADGSADRLAVRAEWPTDWARRRPEELSPEAYFRLAAALARGATAD
jgi:16S rRNA (adenine1518-N6/adenine1519-N6)-dimethyltransferase